MENKNIKKLVQEEQENNLVEITSRIFKIETYKKDGRLIEFGKVSFRDEREGGSVFVSININDINKELKNHNKEELKSGDKIRVVGTLTRSQAKNNKTNEYLLTKNGEQIYNYRLRYISELEILEKAKTIKVSIVNP